MTECLGFLKKKCLETHTLIAIKVDSIILISSPYLYSRELELCMYMVNKRS